ncbi:MAG: site-specific integrase [Planctomycetes bacterium]|nr:site-specific integrase [Planctomycetota bacterium]
MPTPSRTSIPKLGLHRATGQAIVRLNGKDHYLGDYAKEESRARYERLVAEWLNNGRRLPQAEPTGDFTVADVVKGFLAWIDNEYRLPDGSVSREVLNVRLAMRGVYKLFRDLPAEEFGPKSLLLYRDAQVAAGLTRKLINKRVGMVRRAFRWATREERVPASTYHALTAVEGLKMGRTTAIESPGVKPVPELDINKTIPQLSPTVRAMVELQLLTGMRPAEVTTIRPCDIERGGNVWIYRPSNHKNAWRGHAREIAIGPKAQEILTPFLLRSAEDYCFSPDETMEGRKRELREKRKKEGTPLWPSHLRTLENKRRENPIWAPGDCYSTWSYGRAIARACKRVTVTQWSPGRLRHNAATRFRKEFGLEVAGAILGHRILETTQIYAEVNRARALDVAAKVG